jgi:hypothetical protein
MKVKKKFIGSVLHINGIKLYLEEVMDAKDLQFLASKHPKFVEQIKSKKKDDSAKKD